MAPKGWQTTMAREDKTIRTLIVDDSSIVRRILRSALSQHPKIEVVEVFGVPDAKYGEEVAAWIKLHEGEMASAEDIREFGKGKLAYFKIPRYIKFVHEFPMTVTGKVQKFVMRERMAQELGLAPKEPA